MRVVIAAGGTAGHVNPAIALAHEMHGSEITFIGTTKGIEARLVPARGFRLLTLEVRGFDRGRPASIFPTAAIAARAIGTARSLLKAADPQVVVGMGGYITLPVCLAARSLRLPVVLHEQNIVLGLANRACKPLARAVAVSFEETLAGAGRRGVFTGNPVLPELTSGNRYVERERGRARFDLAADRPTLLIFGGSLGAHRLNEAAAGLAVMWADRSDRQILHIAGHQGPAAQPPEEDRPEGLIYRMVDFADRMQEVYAVADVALCRGGATTVAELGVAGLPAVVVPYPHHRDRQQERHARVLASAGAAVVVDDSRATASRVAREVDALLDDPARLAEMRTAAQQFGRPDAARRVARVVASAA